MRDTKAQRVARFFNSMERLGFDYETANKLRLIEKTLQRWSELECGDGNDYASWAIERNEETNKPFMVRHVYPRNGSEYRLITTPVADRETGALKRLAKIMESFPDFVYYHQTDPRGCALYIIPKDKLTDGAPIDSVYTRGFGVCID